jgi:hypothetical protein
MSLGHKGTLTYTTHAYIEKDDNEEVIKVLHPYLLENILSQLVAIIYNSDYLTEIKQDI